MCDASKSDGTVKTKYEIAGHVIRFLTHSAEVEKELADYRYEGDRSPEEVFAITPDVMRDMTERWMRAFEGELEHYLLARRFYAWLAARDGLYLHAAIVAYRGWAYAFTADSGTGKSTHARLWRQAFGEDAVILNDDKPLLRLSDGVFCACGSPWCGKEAIRVKRQAPLRGICLLEQAAVNSIARVSPAEAAPALLAQTLFPEGEEETLNLMSLVDRLVREVPIYRLRCNISEEAARLAYEAMRPKGEDVP